MFHVVYRKRVETGQLAASEYRLPGAPVTTVAALAFLVLVVVLLFFTPDGRTAIVVGAIYSPWW
jgi:amino acid transporter, AAT family